MERAEKRNTFGPMPDPKERMALFMAKLNAQAKRVRLKMGLETPSRTIFN